MSATPSSEILGGAALERVVARARAIVRADGVALLLREEPPLLLVAGACGLEEAATCVLEAERPVVIRDRGVAAGVPVHAAGRLRGALCARGAIDEDDLEGLGDLASLAGDLIEHAERRSKLAGAVEAGVEALAGLLDLRDGSLPRGSAEVVSLAHRVADRLAEADPDAAGGVREMLKERGGSHPAAGQFARRTPPAGAAPRPPPGAAPPPAARRPRATRRATRCRPPSSASSACPPWPSRASACWRCWTRSARRSARASPPSSPTSRWSSASCGRRTWWPTSPIAAWPPSARRSPRSPRAGCRCSSSASPPWTSSSSARRGAPHRSASACTRSPCR